MEDNDSELPETTDIAYGGTIIARIAAGQVATLNCAHKRMRADVIIKAGSGSGGGGNSSVVTDGGSILIKAATVTQVGDDTLTIE